MRHLVASLVSLLLLCLCIHPSDAVGWHQKHSMEIPRWGLTSSVVDGRIFVFGGMMGNGCCQYSALVESYDPATDVWDSPTVMPTPRNALASGVVDDVIHVIGGIGNAGGFNLVEAYNPATDTWEQKTPIPTGRGFHTVAVVNDILYVIGGQSGFNPTGIGRVEAYHPATDTWERRADMPTPRLMLSASVVDGRIYAIGGSSKNAGDAQAFATVEIYDPATDTWTTGADMPAPRSGLSTSVVDGLIYAISGDMDFRPSPSVEIYDPVSDTWVTAEDITTPRHLLTASTVDGTIYAIGGGPGLNQNFPIGLVEALETGLDAVPSPVSPIGKLTMTWGMVKWNQ